MDWNANDSSKIYKVFENFENIVAIFDIDKDGDLDCLTAVRTDYNRGARSTKYVWILKGLHGHQSRNVTYLVLAGPERGEFMFKNLDDDGPFQKGSYDYSDYKNCIVMRIPYNSGEECVLWVTEEVKNNIPQNCMDYYEDSCDNAKLAYDKESCEGVHS
ncbi:uncharacterized protein [Dermacentor albipictus]|uniref:uncharacterized protein n=1 Tax=Dermacentor albipictus TaxID=60249 RepID=UPI0031FC329F